MKKKLCTLLLGLCIVSISACGNKDASDNSESITASNQDEEINEADDDNSAEEKINIEDIAWNVDEGIVDGERYILLDYTNNTQYTIAGFEITFKEKSGITEEEKSIFYSDIQEKFEASDEDIEELKKETIFMHADTEWVVNPGESVENVKCFYYGGYYYLKDINHFKLVEPDIATIKYVDEDKICTVYYDYSSKKYSAETETEVAYQWAQTDIGNKIPKPDVKIVENYMDDEEMFIFDAYGMSLELFNAYVEECKTFGYTIESNSYEGFYCADNEEGYNVILYYDEDDHVMNVTVGVSDESDTITSDEDEINDVVSTDDEKEDATNEELMDGMRPEFKEMVDSYEAFCDEYCDFMKKYAENPSDTELLADYADMLTEFSEMSEKFNAWESNDLNEAEMKYYLDVYNRVNKKILEVL